MQPNTLEADHRTGFERPPSQQRPAQAASVEVTDEQVLIDDEPHLCIRNVHLMAPFLMTVVSDSDLWMFVGSNAGFTAGHRNPDRAIFPYQTVDKILQQPKASGVLSLIEVDGVMWEPWIPTAAAAAVTRNLYKHTSGTSVRFEEIHHGLALKFTWSLAASEKFGIVRSCVLENLSSRPRRVRMLDGWHHMLPPGVTQETYARYSYLAAAYMRHECLADCGLGIYTLNSGISDRAEPCESLRAGVAWSLGHSDPVLLLSDRQVDAFRGGGVMAPEAEIRGEFGAHLISTKFELPSDGTHRWTLVADSGLDHATVLDLRLQLGHPSSLLKALINDVVVTVKALQRRIAGADACQQTAEPSASIHHFANVLFNCMRGGTLHDGYHFPIADLVAYLRTRNVEILSRHASWIAGLPERADLALLAESAARQGDAQLMRLVREYLPLSFSRRHGDPSRPWNRFEIHTKDEHGRPLLGYSGNWRDIFQNWESLAHSYPLCYGSMIAVFLNASTADGYNPYRITRDGIDWEVLDPKDAWSHIGYWGDHQIIYLLRLLEGNERFWPGQLSDRLAERIYAYANVPYEIADFDALVRDPRHSITFDETLHENLLQRSRALGGDGKLCTDQNGTVALVSLLEKLLVPALVKLSNLVPGGGIWLNTQRPEWNDANNALAGWGLSVVTVCYLRRYFQFLGDLLPSTKLSAFEISTPVAELLRALAQILPDAAGSLDATNRSRVMEALGRAGAAHRSKVYQRKTFADVLVPIVELRDFVKLALRTIDSTIESNRRDDGMFHSYNVLEVAAGSAKVHHLDLMLEGQVAALSSGRLAPKAALQVLRAMRCSGLYRSDQHSYLLYPDRKILPFLERNLLPADWKTRAAVLAKLLEAGDRSLIIMDQAGRVHFNADLTNAGDLDRRLNLLASTPQWKEAISQSRAAILAMWEEVFHHQAFTGRSGSMFAFEGLGSIYWHMVAKLLLAAQEIYGQQRQQDPASALTSKLANACEDIRNGLGFTKNAKTYGAFPTDPYSHSPSHRGAQQPGMTGQVKEEILTRMGELGVRIQEGIIHFEPSRLQRSEFFTHPHVFKWFNLHGEIQSWDLPAGSLAFTLFQVPVGYLIATQPSLTVEWQNGRTETIAGSGLPPRESLELFLRTDSIRRIQINIPEHDLPLP